MFEFLEKPGMGVDHIAAQGLSYLAAECVLQKFMRSLNESKGSAFYIQTHDDFTLGHLLA